MKALAFAHQITPADVSICFFGGHDAWNLAKTFIANGIAAVVLPVGQQPSAFDWSIFRGRTLLAYEVSETSREYRRNIVTYAAKAGASAVYAHSLSDDLAEDAHFVGAWL